MHGRETVSIARPQPRAYANGTAPPPRREDYEYLRLGTYSIFIEPLAGWRYAQAFPQWAKKYWVRLIKRLLEERYPEAVKIVLVMDNLYTHIISSLYETFPTEETFSLAQCLEIHYTPKHGSWLNIAELSYPRWPSNVWAKGAFRNYRP